jgi:hypothetical protein
MLNVRFEVLTAVNILMLFWAVTPCGVLGRYQSFGETYCSHIEGVKTQKSNINSIVVLTGLIQTLLYV